MANCANCGKALKEGVKFCASCGTAVTGDETPKAATPAPAEQKKTAAKCANCGKTLKEGMKFCASCGTSITGDPPAPAPQQPATPPTAEQTAVVSTINWLLSLIVFGIPIVGLVIALVWAFGSDSNLNKRNFCRAYLILLAVGFGLGLIVLIAYGSFLAMILNF